MYIIFKESEFLEGPLTGSLNEVLAFLKKMQNDKSPGPDGFFSYFWETATTTYDLYNGTAAGKIQPRCVSDISQPRT